MGYLSAIFDKLFHIWNKSTSAADTFDGDGNVGIGTTSPSAKLEMNGIIKTNTLEVSQGNIQIEAGGTFYSPRRMHISGNEILYYFIVAV